MRDDLQYDLCPDCGESIPVNAGILYHVSHPCHGATYTYRMLGSISLFKMFNDVVAAAYGGRSSMQSFYDLLHFPYLKKMPDFETATESEKRIYGFIRDAEIREMKRLRAYIELEEAFNEKY